MRRTLGSPGPYAELPAYRQHARGEARRSDTPEGRGVLLRHSRFQGTPALCIPACRCTATFRPHGACRGAYLPCGPWTYRHHNRYVAVSRSCPLVSRHTHVIASCYTHVTCRQHQDLRERLLAAPYAHLHAGRGGRAVEAAGGRGGCVTVIPQKGRVPDCATSRERERMTGAVALIPYLASNAHNGLALLVVGSCGACAFSAQRPSGTFYRMGQFLEAGSFHQQGVPGELP